MPLPPSLPYLHSCNGVASMSLDYLWPTSPCIVLYVLPPLSAVCTQFVLIPVFHKPSCIGSPSSNSSQGKLGVQQSGDCDLMCKFAYMMLQTTHCKFACMLLQTTHAPLPNHQRQASKYM